MLLYSSPAGRRQPLVDHVSDNDRRQHRQHFKSSTAEEVTHEAEPNRYDNIEQNDDRLLRLVHLLVRFQVEHVVLRQTVDQRVGEQQRYHHHQETLIVGGVILAHHADGAQQQRVLEHALLVGAQPLDERDDAAAGKEPHVVVGRGVAHDDAAHFVVVAEEVDEAGEEYGEDGDEGGVQQDGVPVVFVVDRSQTLHLLVAREGERRQATLRSVDVDVVVVHLLKNNWKLFTSSAAVPLAKLT